MFLAPVKVSSANFFPPSALLLDNDRYNGLKNFIRPWDRSMSFVGSNAPVSGQPELQPLATNLAILELAKFVQLIEGLDNTDGKSVRTAAVLNQREEKMVHLHRREIFDVIRGCALGFRV